MESPRVTEADRLPALIAAGALFVANHSGGKDSQALLIRLLEVVPATQVLVVHASLGEVEWPGALEHAQAQAEAAGLPFVVARSGKTFFNMVEHRFKVHSSHLLEPQGMAERGASRRRATALAGVPERVHLPIQSALLAYEQLPLAPRSVCRKRSADLQCSLLWRVGAPELHGGNGMRSSSFPQVNHGLGDNRIGMLPGL